MSLTIPFINTIPAIDANSTSDIKINLNILGGDAITGYRYYIYNNNDYTTPIYTSTITSVSNDIANTSLRSYPMILNLSAIGLHNNNTYLISCVTYNETEQSVSNYQYIVCYATPQVVLQYYNSQGILSNLSQNSIIPASTGEFNIKFSNTDLNSIAEPNNAKIDLYGVDFSGNKVYIKTLDNLYKFDYDISNYIYNKSVDITGFIINIDQNGNYLTINDTPYNYYELKLTLSTIENMVITKTYTKINCYYKILINSSKVNLNNLCQKGMVKLDCLLTSIIGTSNTALTYIDNDSVDLTNSNNWAKWENLFALNQPYTLRVWGRNFNIATILELTNTSYMGKYLKLAYNTIEIEDVEYTYISLECGDIDNNGNAMFPYYIESQKIKSSLITSNTNLFIGIQQQNNLFDINFQII